MLSLWANLPKLGQLSPTFESRILAPFLTHGAHSVHFSRMSCDWVGLFYSLGLSSPVLICLKYPTDRSHSGHLWKHFIRFYGLAGFGHHKFQIPRRATESRIGNLEQEANFLNGRHCFTTAVRFIFGHEELERQSCFVSQDTYGPLHLCRVK